MNRRATILIVGDSPVLPSATAEVLRNVFGGLLERHASLYSVQQVALRHRLAVTKPTWRLHPARTIISPEGAFVEDPRDCLGEVTFLELARELKPDLVVGFNDAAGLKHLCLGREDRGHALVLIVRGDGRLAESTWQSLAGADAVVNLSELDRDSCDLEPSKLCRIRLPADTSRFRPAVTEEKMDLRRELIPAFIPLGAFLIGYVGRSRWKDQIWLAYKTLRFLRYGEYLVCPGCGKVSLLEWDPLAGRANCGGGLAREARPGYGYRTCAHCGRADVSRAPPLRDIFLWLHLPLDERTSAWPPQWLEHEYGVLRNRDLFYTEGYGARAALAPEDMPTLYQLWDCLLHLRGGGSLGLPVWEAMCSGLPVVYSDCPPHSAHLSGAKAGLPVGGVWQPEPKTGTFRLIADVSEAIAAVRRLYYHRELGKQLGENGRAYACQFRTEVQVEKWHALFQRVLAGRDRARQWPSS